MTTTSIPSYPAGHEALTGYLSEFMPYTHHTLSRPEHAEAFASLLTAFDSLPTADIQVNFVQSFMAWLENGITTDESRITGLEEEAADRKQVVAGLEKEVADLHRTNAQVSTALALATTKFTDAPADTQRLPPASKTDDPKRFSGDGKASPDRQQKFRTWRQAITLKMFADRRAYPMEQDRIVYAVGRLEGRAAALTGSISRMIEKNVPFDKWPWVTLDSLICDLAKQFDAQDPEAEADQALAQLDMSGKYADWPDFHAEFSKLHTFLDYDKRSKVSQLQQKVSQSLAERVSHQLDTPDTTNYDAWVTLYSKAWDKTQQLKARRRPTAAPAANPAATPAPAAAAAAPVPMDIDSIYRLDPVERQRRYETGACYYCGEMDHSISVCPARQQADARRTGRSGSYRGRSRGRGQLPAPAAQQPAAAQTWPPRGRGYRGGRSNYLLVHPYQVSTAIVGEDQAWTPQPSYLQPPPPGFVISESEASSSIGDNTPQASQSLKD